MNYSAVVLVVVFSLTLVECSPFPVDDDKYIEDMVQRGSHLHFKLWQLEHGKLYSTTEEHNRRYATFQSNLKLIQELNEEHSGLTVFAANKFADMSPEEFGQTILMRKREVPQHSTDKFLKVVATDDPLPVSFDWRDHDMVTSVKDQGAAGTCWAFSTVANIEGQFAMKYQKLLNLSVEQVVDCDDSEDIPKKYGDCGVYGGWPYLAFGYLQRQGGIETEASYPYCAGGGKNVCFVCPNGPWNETICGPPMPYCNMSQSCPYKLKRSQFVKGLILSDWKQLDTGGIETWEDYSYCCGGGNDPCFVCPMGVWNSSLCGPPEPYCNMSQSCPAKLDRSKFVSGLNITGWKAIPVNETIIAQQLQKIGPLSVALDARMLQFYSKGVFNPYFCSKTTLDHAVLIVGFGTDKGFFGDTPYWTIKNSWGPSWGEKGYFRIKRNAGTCGVNTQVTTAILA